MVLYIIMLYKKRATKEDVVLDRKKPKSFNIYLKMISDMSEEMLREYLGDFFNEKGAGLLNKMREGMVEQCFKSSAFRESMTKNNQWLKDLVEEFEEWLKPRVRKTKIAALTKKI